MSKRLCKLVPITKAPIRPGYHAARCQNDRSRPNGRSGRKTGRGNQKLPAAVFIQAHGNRCCPHAGKDLNAKGICPPKERPLNGCCLVAARVDIALPLMRQNAKLVVKKRQQLLRPGCAVGANKSLESISAAAIAVCVLHQIRDVAAPVSGHQELFPGLLVCIQKDDIKRLSALPREPGINRSRKPCHAAANDKERAGFRGLRAAIRMPSPSSTHPLRPPPNPHSLESLQYHKSICPKESGAY